MIKVSSKTFLSENLMYNLENYEFGGIIKNVNEKKFKRIDASKIQR